MSVEPNIFFIADTHFGDENILLYENRPFTNVRIMDLEMFRRWNSVVQEQDIVYHLGDFGAEEHETKLLKELNGTIYLVKGNHDMNSNELYRSIGFAEVYDHPILIQDFFLLSHEPRYINQSSPYVLIHGHVHNNPIYNTVSSNSFCVSAERIDYTPISFLTIKQRILDARRGK